MATIKKVPANYKYVLATVRVNFADPKYNYVTTVSGTREEIERYFVGAWFNMGAWEKDDMQECVEIEIIPNNSDQV